MYPDPRQASHNHSRPARPQAPVATFSPGHVSSATGQHVVGLRQQCSWLVFRSPVHWPRRVQNGILEESRCVQALLTAPWPAKCQLQARSGVQLRQGAGPPGAEHAAAQLVHGRSVIVQGHGCMVLQLSAAASTAHVHLLGHSLTCIHTYLLTPAHGHACKLFVGGQVASAHSGRRPLCLCQP